MGANVSAFRRKSASHLTEARVLESLLDLTVQAPCGTDGETKAQEGRDLCPGSSSWLVADPT